MRRTSEKPKRSGSVGARVGESATDLLDAIAAAADRVNGRGDLKPFPPLVDRVWYDSDGNLLTRRTDAARYVMMEFERPLMEKSAEMLCRGGGHILNVGFGCGIIDTAIQRHRVASHTIVEGHPAVYRRMIQAGWARKRNVRIIHERWENVDWWNYAGRFDGVYFDPFPLDAVPYEQVLWRECLIKVLKPDTGVFVLYGPTLNRSKVRREAARFRKRAVLDSVDSCVVDVAFPTPEWQELGVGRHRVEVFSLRIPSRRWNQR